MADNKYQIQLGVDLDTSDLKADIAKLDDKYKLKLGVNVGVEDIRKRISEYNKNTNNAKLKLGIKLDTSDLKEQIKNLSIDGKNAKGISLPLNTTSLETSLRELKEVIAEIKSSFNSLDGGDMKSLLSSVNQIVTALGKAEDESDSLVKSLSALSKKDFSINLGIDMNKKGLNTIGYGRAARKQVIPELESQIKYLENLFGGQQAAMSRLLSQGKNVNFDVFTGFDDFNSDSAIKKMEAMEKYINALKKLASIDNINLDGFNEIHKDASNLINDITGIENAVDKAGDVPEKIKNLFGVGVDGENLTRQLDFVVANLGEIKTAIQGLSSGISIDGLTQSFDRLSDTIEKLVQNCTTAKKAINDSLGNAGSSVGNTGSETTIKETSNELKKLKDLARQIGQLDFKIVKSDYKNEINQVKEFERQLELLKTQYNETLNSLNGKDINIGLEITKEFTNARNKIAEFEAKIADTRVELAKKIEINLVAGEFSTKVQNVEKNINNLSNATKELRLKLDALKTAESTMNSAFKNGSVGERIKAWEDYKRALQDVENQYKRNKIAEDNAFDANKLKLSKEALSSDMKSWLRDNSAAAKQFGDTIRQLQSRLEACDNGVDFNNIKAEFRNVTKEAKALGLTGQSAFDKLKTKFKEYASYLSAAEIFMYAEQGLRSMFEQVKLIDSAMTELRKVTDETDESYNNFLTNAATRAREIGTTIDGLVESTADFARLGYGFKDAQGLAEVANIYAVVGDDIESVESATESLISTLTAFKEEANGLSSSDFAMNVVDKMNEVADTYSISSGGLGEALKRSASSMQTANNTLDETIALITAANEVTQSPEVVGQAFKTISMRIRGAKTELEEAGESTDGMAASTASLRQEIMALSGVDIMLNEDTFKSTYQILDELSQKWEGLSDIAQASIIELVAGKHRGNVMSSLMENFDTARSALETSMNSAGSAMREHERWSQSLEAKLNSLAAAWQGLSQAFLSSDFLKAALDGVIGLVDGITSLIDAIGVIPTLSTVFAAFQSVRGEGLFKVIEDDAARFGHRFTNIFSEVASRTKNIFKEIGLQKDSLFKASIDADIEAFNKYTDALADVERLNKLTGLNESIDETTFSNIFKNASDSAKEFAASGKLAADGIDAYVNSQKAAQVSTLAQNKSLGNAKAIINEYYNGCKNVAMSTADFAGAVSKTNQPLANAMTTTKSVSGAMVKYTTSLIASKAATIGLQIATTALNAVIGVGIGMLVSAAISAITKWINAEEDLAKEVEEVTSKFQEQHSQLQKLKGDFDTSNESSMISKYERLSKGVDNLGRNVSLTANEYSEYQGIVNKIADQFPSLINGYDSQGNALLSCKDNVEALTQAYEDMISAQNRAIFTNAGKIGEDFANKVEENNYTGLWGTNLSEDVVSIMEKDLDRILKLEDGEDFVKTYYGSSNGISYGKAIEEALENAGLAEFDKWSYDYIFNYDEVVAEAFEKAAKTNPKAIRSIIDEFRSGLETDVAEMKSIAQATLSDAFDLSDSEFYDMSDTMQSVVRNIVNGFDYEFYKQYKDNPLGVQTYINDMLEQFKTFSDTEGVVLDTAFNLKTQFNNGDISYGEYVKGLENAGKTIDDLDLDEEVKTDIKLNLGLNEDGFVEEYQQLYKRLTSEEFDIQMKADEAKKLLNELSASEYAVVVDLISNGEVDLSNFDIESLRKYIEKQVQLNEAMNFTIAMDVETESVEALNTAMSESVSGAGLSSEAIAALKGRYAELESEGYNLSAMFEETSNGIHLNRRAVSELEKAYASEKLSETNDKLGTLKNRYDELTKEIDECSNARDRAALYTEQQSVVEKINDLATLASQYKGLTSAYNEWLSAEEAGQERDMYENILEGFENIDDELSRGWLDDGTIEFLELLTGRTDLASKSGSELKKIYDDLDDTIKNTSYSVRDFFTVDDDGNSTNTGVYNFLDAIGQLEEEKFDGKDVVKRDKNGNIIGFDFKLVGGDEAIAEALGISEELVQIMVRAADDAGFVVNLEGAYTQLADLKTEAETARDTLISLQKDGLEKLQGVDVNFNLDAEGNNLVTEQEKAVKLLDKFKKDGKIDLKMEGAQEALDIAEYLTIKLDDLTEPKFMQIDTSDIDENLRDPIEKIQEIGELCKEKHLVSLTGDTKDIKEVQSEINKVAKEIEELEPEVKAQIGIDDDWDAKTIADKIEKGEIQIPAELELDVQMSEDLKDMRLMMMKQLGLVSDNEVKLKIGYDIDDSAVDRLTEEEKEISVKFIAKNEEWFEKLTNEEKEVVIKYVAKNKNFDELTEKEQEIIVKIIGDDSELKDWTPEEKKALVKYVVDGGDVENWTPEEKRAWAKYLVDGGDVDGWTPEMKDAYVNYIVDGGEVDGWTPEDKRAFAKYIVDGGDPDSYVPPSKTQKVKADLDSSEPDNKQYSEKTQPVLAKLNSSAVDNYKPPEKTMTIWAKIKKKASDLWDKITGGGGVDGTAHVDGTAFVEGTVRKSGRAFKQGNWGTKDSGIALGGEEAPELLVRNGKWHLIGEKGAEFFGYKKGDIIFNASQTKEIFEKGKITHGNGRGKALANGTAFAYGSSGIGSGIGKVVAITKDGDVSSKKKITKSTTKTTTKSSGDKTTITTTTEVNSSGSSGSGGGVGKVEGNSVGSNNTESSSSSTENKFEDTIDWIKTILDRAERAIDKYEKQANNVYKTWDKRNKALENEIAEVDNTISLYEQAKNKYLSEANAVGLNADYAAKVRNGSLSVEDFEGESDEKLVEKIKNYQDLYEKYLDCIDKIEELKEQEASLYSQRFDYVSEEYENLIQGFDHTQSMLDEYINQAEEKGYIVSKNYYNALIDNEEDRIKTLQQEQAALIQARDEAVANNEFDKYSSKWFEMCADIDAVTQAIEAGTTSLIEYNNAIRDIDFEVFELMQERISDITAEADFLIELMSHKDLFDDKGNLTEQGQATIGLHGQNYNVLMHQADDYGAKVAEIDKQIAEDPYDQELINKRREYLELQRESILNAENEKDAIVDLVQEGIDLELDSLGKLIDKYQDALQSQKDLYDYQRKVEEQTKEISSLQKQLSAYEGDNSEEAKAKIQELRVSLEEAEADLEETEYDKYISDTSALLDNLYAEYELMLNERIDNIDYLIAQQIEAVNANALAISETLSAEADAVGYTLSDAMNNIWNGEQAVLTMYGDDFSSKATNINTTLNGIKTSIDNMVVALNKEAEKKITANKTTTSAKKDPVKTTTNNNNNKTSNNNKKEEPKRVITNDTLMGIAAAIWNYQKENYGGWGANPDRKKKLTDKLGAENAAKVQQYINSYGATGKLYDFWVSKGKNLNNYKYSAFKLGAKNIDESQLAWTQENGQEYIIRPSDGAILTPVAKGDSVLTSAATNNIWSMANSPAEFIKDNLNLGSTSVPNNSTVQNSITQNFDKVVFSMPNVQNYEQLITQMQRDPNFERLIDAMSIGRLAGKSSLAKGKAIR